MTGDKTMNIQAIQQHTHVTEEEHMLTRIVAELSKEGQQKLGEHLGVTKVETGRKLNSETGLKLKEIATLFEAYGIEITTEEQREGTVLVNQDKYKQLLFDQKRLNEIEINAIDNVHMFRDQAS